MVIRQGNERIGRAGCDGDFYMLFYFQDNLGFGTFRCLIKRPCPWAKWGAHGADKAGMITSATS